MEREEKAKETVISCPLCPGGQGLCSGAPGQLSWGRRLGSWPSRVQSCRAASRGQRKDFKRQARGCRTAQPWRHSGLMASKTTF